MITYPLIASEILNRLSEGPKRSSTLTKNLGFSSKLIYQTLDELTNESLISVQTDLPKFKVYQITKKGSEIVIDSEIKSQSGFINEMTKSNELNQRLTELLALVLRQHTQQTNKFDLADVDPIFVGAAAAHSRRIKRMFDEIDNQASNTIASSIEVTTNAT